MSKSHFTEQSANVNRLAYIGRNTVFSLQQAGIPAILLVIGQGAKRKAVRWCLSQQSELLKVFDSFEAFLLRANGGLL